MRRRRPLAPTERRGLSGLFDAEPRWVDLRWAQDAGSSVVAHPRFRDAVADIAAPLHGRAKDDLIGEDVRQARRLRRLTSAAITLLTVLTMVLGWMFVEAERSRQVAAVERDRALTSQSHYFADAALRQAAEGEPDVGVLLALEALPGADRERPYVPAAEGALHTLLSKLGIKRIARLQGKFTSAELSPDGTRLVTTSLGEDTPRVWDAQTGKQLFMLRGDQGSLHFAAYHPDGRVIMTASVDRTVRFWNAADGEPIRVFRGHQGPVLHAAVSSDGRLLATAFADSTGMVWETATGLAVATLRGHTGALCCVRFSPDASRVVTASTDGTARLWTASGKSVATFSGMVRRFSTPTHTSAVVRFSPDGRLVATAHADHTLRLWSADDGSPVAALKGHTGLVNDAAFSLDNRLLATASSDGGARLWRIGEWTDRLPISAAGELRPKQALNFKLLLGDFSLGPVLATSETAMNAVVFSPEGNLALTGGADALRLWDLSTADERAAWRLDQSAQAIALSQDGRRFATTHLHSVSLWEVAAADSFTEWRARRALERIEPSDGGAVTVLSAKLPGFASTEHRRWEPPVALTRDGKTAAAVTGRHVVLLNGATGRVIASIAAHARVVSHIAFDRAGDRLLTTSFDGSAKIWDARSGAPIATLTGHEKPVVHGAFSPAGAWIATVSEDRTARLWNERGVAVAVLRGHGAAVRSVAFSRDGRRIITASADGTARVWDVASGKPLATLGGDDAAVGVVALSASGDRAAGGGIGEDYSLRLWDVSTGTELHRWQEHRGTVAGLTFSADGHSLLAWAADGVARLWNTQGQYARRALYGHGCMGSRLHDAVLSEDEEWIVTVLESGRIDVWDARSGAPLSMLHSKATTRFAPPCTASPVDPKVTAIASSPDLRHLLIAEEHDALMLFAIPGRDAAIRRARQAVPRALTPQEREQFFLTEPAGADARERAIEP